MTDAGQLKGQVQAIVTLIEQIQRDLQKAKLGLEELSREILTLDLTSKSMHVASSARLLPVVIGGLEPVPFDLSLIASEMIQYRNKL